MSTGPLLDALLKSVLGDQARFSTLSPEAGDAMAASLAAAELLIGAPRRAIWVVNGPGVMFSLQQPEPGTVVVSDRAIDYTSRIQDVLVGDASAERLGRLAEYIFFTIASEHALQQGHDEVAVKALTMSVVGTGLRPADLSRPESVHIGQFAMQSLAERCFGLLHELGHLAPNVRYGHLTSDETLLRFLDWVSNEWFLGPEVLGDTSERAKDRFDSSVVGLEHLRSEVHADLFAVEALFEAALTMTRNSTDGLEWADFILQAHAAQQAVVVFDRLRRAVALAESSAPTRDDAIEMMLQPISVGVRNLAQQEFIAGRRIMEIAATGVQPTPADVARERQFVHDCLRPKEKHYQIFDDALDKVIDFILNRQRQADQRMFLEQLTAAVSALTQLAPIIERFVDVAEGLGHSTFAIVALRRLVNDMGQR
jgi:hypothetical protein